MTRSSKQYKKAKHNLIYKIRQKGECTVDTRARTIYYHYENAKAVKTRRHARLVKEYQFGIQSKMF